MKKRKIIIIVLLLCICCPFFSITLHADEKQITDTAKPEILKENRKNLDKNGIIYEDINFTDDYLIAKTIEKKEIDFDTTKYITNLSTYSYDPIGSTFSGSLYTVQIIVYVDNKYNTGVTFRKPVYYTQRITSFDNGLGNPATLTTSSKFVGVWGPVGDPQNYGAKQPSSLKTTGTNIGTRYTNISDYFAVSMTNSCSFTVSVLWNVKQGGQITLNDEFNLW